VYGVGGLRKYFLEKMSTHDLMEGCKILGEYKAHGFGLLSGERVFRYEKEYVNKQYKPLFI
jgi:hypothetical protein